MPFAVLEEAGDDENEETETEITDIADIADIDEIEEDETETETEDESDDEVTVGENILTVMTVTKNGFGKRCEFEKFTRRNRGGKGMACHKVSERTGELVGVLGVLESDDIMIITDDGTMIRTPVSGIPVKKSRGTGGVIVMRMAEGISIKSVIRVAAAENGGENDEIDETAVDEIEAVEINGEE